MEGIVVVTKQDQFRWRILEDFRSGKIRRLDAAQSLGLSERRIQRLAKRFCCQALEVLKHGNHKRPPVNLVSEDLKAHVLELARLDHSGPSEGLNR